MKKIKISALPEGDSLKGLYTIGTDANNESVKVSLEFVETAAESANSAASSATTAAEAANTAAAAANTAAQNANEALENITYTGLVIPTSMELAETITVGGTGNDDWGTEEGGNEEVASFLAASGGTYINPVLSPAGAMNNFIFLNEDDSVCTIGPDGLITPVAAGSSKVTVIPTFNTSLAKTVTVTVISSSNTYLNISPTSWNFGTDTDETAEILINSSSAWTATGVPSDMALSATSGSAGISAIILSRTSTSLDGTATITFKNEDGDEATLSVTRTAVLNPSKPVVPETLSPMEATAATVSGTILQITFKWPEGYDSSTTYWAEVSGVTGDISALSNIVPDSNDEATVSLSNVTLASPFTVTCYGKRGSTEETFGTYSFTVNI